MDARNHDLPLQLEDHYASEAEYGHGAGARSTISIADILETLRRGWRYPVYGLLIGFAAAAVYVVSVKVPYKSSARILIDRSVSRYLQTNKIIDQPTFDESEIASQVYVLSSDSVVLPVVRSLKLTHDSEFVSQQRHRWRHDSGSPRQTERNASEGYRLGPRRRREISILSGSPPRRC